ncbi:MFS transporter [Pleomorphomonas diazotrophica]|uniref:MFS transporter n=1 Tax=Pleomorphomonas diazotrophica TaxID=1166257 RepID=A0A1I4V795_9HYPH|nr:MFS transporter [Pleomorphomonas diazotrophica]PKR87385.1 MFS transporter [Pleomorphomonas diazotrophica]SFM97099.1 Predicted arabinose efflux permease, MFS family [Pleomorphomonas diazotrophica]
MTIRPDTQAEAGKRAGLALHAVTLVAFLAASSAPSPLYPLYQAAWGFSPFMITVIFAVYAAALLVTLLFFGAVSNHWGRRPVIALALGAELLSMALFLVAQDGGWLLAARLVQGFATALATTALAAALLDLDHKAGATINSIAPMIGMGVGALGSGLLAQVAPLPLRFVYVLLIAIFLIQLVRSLRSAETAASLSEARWSPRPRIEVPEAARRAFWRVAPLNIGAWALGGFFLSLMPSLIREISQGGATWLGGGAVAALTFTACASILIYRNRTASAGLFAGGLGSALGMAIILGGVHLASPALLLAGAVVSGIGFGAGFLGATRSIIAKVTPQERAGLMSAFYFESYLSNAVPAMIAGYAARHVGLVETATVFGAVIIALSLLSLALPDAPCPRKTAEQGA